jgi:hypothetical protein
MMRCRAWYTDHLGTLEGTLTLEHCRFALEVGGVRFEGGAPDMLLPVSHTPWAQLDRFDCDGEGLGGCELEWVQPMTLDVEGHAEPAELSICAILCPTHARSDAIYTLALEYAGALHQWTHSDLQDCLNGLFDLSPPTRGLRCCYRCARGTYLPLCATPAVGGVRCLLGHEAGLKLARLRATGHAEQVTLHYLLERAKAPYVAETYVCAHHTRTLEP